MLVLSAVAWVVACSGPLNDDQNGTLLEDGAIVPSLHGIIGDTDETVLSMVSSVAIGPEGLIYVGLPLEQTIRVFDQQGNHRRDIGRNGSGPGEFRWIESVGFVADTLHAGDPQLYRVTMFGMDGTYSRHGQWISGSGAFDGNTRFEPTPPQVIRSDGVGLVAVGTASPEATLPVAGTFVSEFSRPLMALQPYSADGDTLAWEVQVYRWVGYRAGQQSVWFPAPYSAMDHAVLMRDGSGVVTVTPHLHPSDGIIRVAAIGPGHDTAWSVGISYLPRPLDSNALDAEAEAIAHWLTRSGISPQPDQIKETLRRHGALPATVPPVTALATGHDGTTWLRRERVSATVAWDVLGHDGSYRGRVLLPLRDSVLVSRDSTLVTMRTDSLDTSYIRIYRLP